METGTAAAAAIPEKGLLSEVKGAATLDELRAIAARQAALLGADNKSVRELNRVVAKLEGGSSAYQAPAVAYDADQVSDAILTILASSEETLKDGGTILLKIVGGDVRNWRQGALARYKTSRDGIRELVQPVKSGSGVNPQAIQLQDNPDGTWSLKPSHEGAFDPSLVETKSWK